MASAADLAWKMDGESSHSPGLAPTGVGCTVPAGVGVEVAVVDFAPQAESKTAIKSNEGNMTFLIRVFLLLVKSGFPLPVPDQPVKDCLLKIRLYHCGGLAGVNGDPASGFSLCHL